MLTNTYTFKRTCSQGTTFVNQYVIIRQLGQGAHGRVKLALNVADDRLYAIKMISRRLSARGSSVGSMPSATEAAAARLRRLSTCGPGEQPLGGGQAAAGGQQQQAQPPVVPNSSSSHEIALLKKLHHPNIVRLREVRHLRVECLPWHTRGVVGPGTTRLFLG